jgi:hypothetical protein
MEDFIQEGGMNSPAFIKHLCREKGEIRTRVRMYKSVRRLLKDAQKARCSVDMQWQWR